MVARSAVRRFAPEALAEASQVFRREIRSRIADNDARTRLVLGELDGYRAACGGISGGVQQDIVENALEQRGIALDPAFGRRAQRERDGPRRTHAFGDPSMWRSKSARSSGSACTSCRPDS